MVPTISFKTQSVLPQRSGGIQPLVNEGITFFMGIFQIKTMDKPQFNYSTQHIVEFHTFHQ